MQPMQTAPPATLAAIIAATTARPAIAVSRTADETTGAGLPCAARRRRMSGKVKATALQTSPQPAIGSPDSRWTATARAPFQIAEQSSAPPAEQNEDPPDRRRMSWVQRNRDQSADSAATAASLAARTDSAPDVG